MVAMSSLTRGPQANGEGFWYAVNLSAAYFYIEWQACEIIDISKSGATIRTRQILMGRDKVVLRLTHGGQSASVKANVLHQSGLKAHLIFDDTGSEDKALFLELINNALYEKSKDRAMKFGMDA